MTDARHFRFHAGQDQTNKAVWANFKAHLAEERERLFAAGQDLEVTVKPYKAKRSLAQNRLLWGVIYREIRDHINDSQGAQFSDEDIHEWCRQQFLDSHIVEIRGDPVRARKSTASLSVEQMTEYIDRLYHWAATSLGLRITEPVDLLAEAYGR